MQTSSMCGVLSRWFAAVLAAVASAASAAPIPCPHPTTILISRNASGTDSADGYVDQPVMTSDGRFIAYQSHATNAVSPAVNVNSTNLYVYDRLTGITRAIDDGAPGGGYNDYLADPHLSENGRFVAFQTQASNVVGGDNNNHVDVFVRDLWTGEEKRVSVPDKLVSAQESFRGGDSPSMDASGDLIAFKSQGTVFTLDYYNAGETGTQYHIYVRNRKETERTTIRLTRTAEANKPINGVLGRPAMSADGRFIAFVSSATNLKGWERTVGKPEVYIAAFDDGQWSIIQHVPAAGNGISSIRLDEIAISPDGHYVAYVAPATAGGADDLWVWDVQKKEARLIRQDVNGLPIASSPSGRQVLHPSLSTSAVTWQDSLDLTGEGVGGAYYLDLNPGGLMQRVGRNVFGNPLKNSTNGITNLPQRPTVSGYGRWVAYRSAEGDIVSPDNNRLQDVFVQDMQDVKSDCPTMAMDLINPIPFENATHSGVIEDPALLAQQVAASPGVVATMRGLAADGVARLLVRVIVPEPTALQLHVAWQEDDANCPGDPPRIESVDGAQHGTSFGQTPVPLGDGRYVAFAVLRAPDDFVRQGSTPNCQSSLDQAAPVRHFLLDAHTTLANGTQLYAVQSVELKRPPLVLVHGIWAKPSTWSWPLPETLYTITKTDYSDTWGASFETNTRVVASSIQQAVARFNDDRIQTARADVIAHSMGAVLTRHYATGTFYPSSVLQPYARPDNFDQGDVHKLILVNSPQFGSELANLLWDQETSSGIRAALIRGLFALGFRSLAAGAVHDLQTPPRSPYTSWPALAVRAAALTGDDSPNALNDAGALKGLALFLRLTTGVNVSDAFGNCPNDGIVALWSQNADLTQNALTPFIGPQAVHTAVTSAQGDGIRAQALLNAGANFGLFSYLPAGPTLPVPQCGTSAPATVQQATNGGVIVVPSATTVVAGHALTVTLQTFGQYTPVEGMLTMTYGDSVVLAGSPLSATFVVPANVTGPFDVMAVTHDAGSFVSAPASAHILVDSGSALQGLRVDRSSGLTFTDGAPLQSLHVVGKFADNVERELPGGDYVSGGMLLHATMTSSNPAAVTVNAHGVLVAHDPGTSIITVTSGTMSTTSSVIVRASAHPACSDGIDNDGDGLVDYPNDPGCRSPNDLTEFGGLTRCDDGIDNDGDGVIDFPADVQCSSAAFDFESAPPTATATVSCNGNVCTFDGRGSTGDASLTTFLWNFGDAATASGALVTHTYATSGNYTATLQVTDADGQSSSTSVAASPNGQP